MVIIVGRLYTQPLHLHEDNIAFDAKHSHSKMRLQYRGSCLQKTFYPWLTGHSGHVPILYSWGNRWRYNTASACFQKILSLESREQNLITASKKTDTNTKYTLRPSVKCYSGNFIIQIHTQARRTLLCLINRLPPWRSLILAVHSSVYSWKYCHRYITFAGHAHGLSISSHLQKCLAPKC